MPPILTLSDIFARVDALDPHAYRTTRNYADGAVTRLSPYISRGVVTLPQLRDRLLARVSASAAEKFVQEFAWREYFQRVWWAKGEAIFTDLRFPRTDWAHYGVVSALVAGRTGVAVIDEAVAELY